VDSRQTEISTYGRGNSPIQQWRKSREDSHTGSWQFGLENSPGQAERYQEDDERDGSLQFGRGYNLKQVASTPVSTSSRDSERPYPFDPLLSTIQRWVNKTSPTTPQQIMEVEILSYNGVNGNTST
jgi:hypothetical protein